MGILEDVINNAAEESDKAIAKQKAKLAKQKQDDENNAGS